MIGDESGPAGPTGGRARVTITRDEERVPPVD